MATRTRLARTPIDVQLQSKITRFAIAFDEIAQCRPADFDRFRQNLANCEHDPRVTCDADPSGRALRVNAGAVERFARVNVADPDDDPPVHDHVLNRRATAACRGVQIGGIEQFVPGFRSEVCD